MRESTAAAQKSDTVARYAEIQRTLENAIVSGEWPPGARVPSEQELLKRYRCSRMTVNKALSALAASGLIVRRRRAGSFVATPEVENNVLQIHDTEEEVLRDGKSYRIELLSSTVRKANAQDRLRLRLSGPARVRALTCIHFADNRPILVEDRVINLAAVPAAETIDFSKRSPGNWLLAKVPWSEAEHHIRASNAGADVAAALEIRSGDACLVVERRTHDADRSITHVVLSYPGDSYQLVARFHPSRG